VHGWNQLYHFEELSNICLLCIKVLRRLITAHIGHSDDPDIVSVFDVSQSLLSSEVVEGVLKALPEHMSGMLNRRISVTSDTVREKLEKHILTATKMVRERASARERAYVLNQYPAY